MAYIAPDNLRHAADTAESIWLYFSVFVMSTMQIVLLNDLFSRVEASSGPLPAFYAAIPAGLVVILGLRVAVPLFDSEGA